MKRRDFLRGAVVGAAASMLPGSAELAFGGRWQPRLKGGSILNKPAVYSPIDTIVVVMMENRSFDHYLGWLANDEAYIEAGLSAYGSRFRIAGSQTQQYAKPDTTLVDTYHLETGPTTNPFRGCPFGDPGHSWTAGRAQRDHGFLATGTGNDELALGYYLPEDLPFYAALAKRFTIFDHYHASLLGPTYPNRHYMHGATSQGIKNNAFPSAANGYPNGYNWPTIWDKLAGAFVPRRYYYSDLPFTALYGDRYASITSPISRYFEDAAAGTLPNVCYIDPKFIGAGQTDEHPLGDVRAGQRFIYEVVKAFIDSPQWHRSVMFLTYDEWGGFFDHVPPPVVRDDRASEIDLENFGQLGFRVPTRMISPYARPGLVDNTLYDHSSILRFIEWRFLNAPKSGTGRRRYNWWLTERDRRANNIGYSLRPDNPDPEVDLPVATTDTSGACGSELTAFTADRPVTDFEQGYRDGFFQRMGYKVIES